MPTIYDVAHRANVSITTVSKVLSNKPYVSTKTRQRILEVMEELNYTPSLAARGLTGKRTYILGLVIPYTPDYLFSDPFLLDVIRGIDFIADENDYNLLLSVTHQADQRSAYKRLLRTGYVDGVIAIETYEGDKAAKELDQQGIPYVTIGYRGGFSSHNSVHSNDYSGAYQAITHLLELGHRRIAVISGPLKFMAAIEERLRGVQDALAAKGLKLDPELVTYGDFTIESGYAAAIPLLNLASRPTGIFAMNDRMAVGLMRRARECKLKIPNDLSLVGFDDVAMTVVVEPQLTTMRQNGIQLGQKATRQLLELVNERVIEFDPIVFPVELVVRGSTMTPNL